MLFLYDTGGSEGLPLILVEARPPGCTLEGLVELIGPNIYTPSVSHIEEGRK